MESHARSWAKSVTWRLIGIIILGGLSYMITRNWAQTTVITSVFHIVRFVLYYYHERVWELVSWGKLKHPLSRFPVKEDLTSADYEAIAIFLEERKCLTRPDYEI